MLKMSFHHLPLFVLVFFVQVSLAADSKQLPVEAFASLPDVSQVRLSPDGQNVSAVVRVQKNGKDGLGVMVFNIDKNEKRYIVFSDNEKYRIKRVSWANNEKLFVSAIFPASRYGTPTDETRLLIADINTKDMRSAVPKRYLKKFDRIPQLQDRIIDRMPDDDEHFLLALDGYQPNEPTVYKVSLSKNKMSTVKAAKHDVVGWITDRQHRVRIGVRRDDTEYEILHQAPDSKKLDPLWTFEALSAEQVWPIGFDEDPNILYVNALHEGRDAIFTVNLQDPELKKNLKIAHDQYDVDGSLVFSPAKKQVVGIESNTRDGYLFWDDDYKGLMRGINKALKDTRNELMMLNDNDQRYLLMASSDRESGVFMVGDREKKTLSPVASRYKYLLPELMAEKKHVSYEARDGLKIEGFLTLPLGAEEDAKLPTIIFPHGGPISFDGNGFDYWTQFFANRGYAVLQMNFRGSSGYGHDFMAAGLQNWGKAMQDDVEDGTRWMIEQGYTDQERICIVGGSYGGYAALMGAAKSPELYRCAISFAGVTDLKYLVSSSRRYTNYELVKKQVGSKRGDLKDRSPVKRAEAIKAPVLLIHGTKDNVVRVAHSRRMEKALKRHDVPVEYIELEGGNHYLSNNEHRLTTFRAIESFLANHLGSTRTAMSNTH